jgi:hypothetical protein
VENLFDEENAPRDRRPDKVRRAQSRRTSRTGPRGCATARSPSSRP